MDGQPASETCQQVDIHGIMRMLPHRYPFLLIDRVVDLIPGESATGVKNVTINEPFFPGHFPARPVMPGVLIVEAMAQTAAVVVVASLGASAEGKLVYFMTIENARFRKPVEPGNQLMLSCKKERQRMGVWRFSGEARVGDTVVAEAVFSAMIMDS